MVNTILDGKGGEWNGIKTTDAVRFMLNVGVPACGPTPNNVLPYKSEYTDTSIACSDTVCSTPLEHANWIMSMYPGNNEIQELVKMLQEAQEEEIAEFVQQQQASSPPPAQ